MVEPRRNVPCELQMLCLVGTDGHIVRLIEENIARHQRRVREKPCVDVLGMLCRLVLELRHARKIAKWAETREHPAHLCMRGDVTLDEDEALLGIEAACQQQGKRRTARLPACSRLLIDRERVQVGDKIIAVIRLLQTPPVLHRAEVVAEGEGARGLNAAEDDLAAGGVCVHFVHDVPSFIVECFSIIYHERNISKGRMKSFAFRCSFV